MPSNERHPGGFSKTLIKRLRLCSLMGGTPGVSWAVAVREVKCGVSLEGESPVHVGIKAKESTGSGFPKVLSNVSWFGSVVEGFVYSL